jgi:transcriptional regulator
MRLMDAEPILSVRTYKRLRDAGFDTLKQLAGYPALSLLALKGFGRKSARELDRCLRENHLAGLQFPPTPRTGPKGPRNTEKKQAILALADAGLTLKEMAGQAGCSCQYCSIVLKRAGVTRLKRKRRRRAERFTLDECQAIAARYRAGETLQAIARSLKSSHTVIRRALQRAGEPIRTQQQACRLYESGGSMFDRKITPEQEQEAVGRYLAGEGTKAIARDMPVSAVRVGQIVKAAGVKRTRQQAMALRKGKPKSR